MSYAKYITLFALLVWLSGVGTVSAQNLETFRDARNGKVIFIKNRPAISKDTVKASAIDSVNERKFSVPQTYYLAEGWRAYNDPPPAPSGMALPGDDPILVSDAFIEAHGRVFGLKDPINELIPYTVKNDGKGMLHINYYQQYQGVPVFGSEIIVHVGADKEVRSANGRAVTDISIDATPSLSEEEAIAAAKGFYRQQFTTPEPQVMKTKLWVFNPGLLENQEDPSSFVVFEVELDNLEPQVNEQFFVDAKTGELVFQLTGIRRDNPYTIDRNIWDCSLNAYLSGNGCGLNRFSPSANYTFGCSEGNCPRGPLPGVVGAPYAGTADTDELYVILNHIHDYLWLKFQRSGGNGRGGIGDNSSHGVGFVP